MVRLVDHIWELCLVNDCHGLGRYSESAFEGVHKVIVEKEKNTLYHHS
jgi:hypothetical protein